MDKSIISAYYLSGFVQCLRPPMPLLHLAAMICVQRCAIYIPCWQCWLFDARQLAVDYDVRSTWSAWLHT